MRTSMLITCLLLSSLLCNAQYKNLVLKGGGIRGIAYPGAIKVLEEKHITDSLEKVGGTSIGAVVAAMLSVGVNAREMEQLMMELDVASFNDGGWFFIGGSRRMRHNYGWYKGNKLESWLAAIIKKHTGSDSLTFMQLHQLAQKDTRYKDLYVTATNLSTQSGEIFSWGNHPNMSIKTAVRASVSIPLYYGAVFIDSAGNSHKSPPAIPYSVYADGGLKANYPITMFNTAADNAAGVINKNTLGLKLERPEQIGYCDTHIGLAPFTINSIGSYIGAVYNLTIEQLSPAVPYAEEKKHTIYISTSNLSPKVRKITRQQKQQLFTNGLRAATDYFSH